jgi:hypothetical protein
MPLPFFSLPVTTLQVDPPINPEYTALTLHLYTWACRNMRAGFCLSLQGLSTEDYQEFG